MAEFETEEECALDTASRWLEEALKAENLSPGDLQWKYRIHPEKFEPRLGELAICDAIIEQGGYIVYPGDGVSCAAQMIEEQWFRANKLQNELDELKRKINGSDS